MMRKLVRTVATAAGILLFAATLASCTLGPNYHRPTLATPTTYKSARNNESAPPKLDREWWRLFHDPDLDRLEQEALQSSLTLQAAMARVVQTRASASAVASAFYPVIGLSPSAVRTRRPVLNTSSPTPPPSITASGSLSGNPSATTSISASHTSPGMSTSSNLSLTMTPNGPALSATGTQRTLSTPTAITSNSIQIPFDLSYEIDIWGRVRRSYQSAKAQTQASIDDLEVVRQTLLADVAQNYFNLRALDDQDQILNKNLDLYREEVDLTKLQLNAGLANETAVAQAQAQLEATRVQEIENRRQRADLEHTIAILIGKAPSDFSLQVRPLAGTPPVIPAGLPADLLRDRPDVAEAEQNLAAASAQIGVAMAAFYPTVKLTGSAGFESLDLQHSLDWKSRLLSFGPGVSLPIFQGGQLRANLRQAKARYEELQATYRNAVLTAFSDVENSLTDLHLRADEAQAQAKATAAARHYLALTRTQYHQGLANYLQVIDAERTVLTDEIAASQIRSQRMVSTVLFIKALGGGWDARTANPKPITKVSEAIPPK